MNASTQQCQSDSTYVGGQDNPGGRVASMLRAGVGALLLLGGVTGALAQTVDTATRGGWIGTYGKCAYILSSPKVPPLIETPILGPGPNVCDTSLTGSCPNGPGGGLYPPFPPVNYSGGASSDLQDCKGQTSPAGLIDGIAYNVRLCSVPPRMPTDKAQGYLYGCFPSDNGTTGFQSYQSALQYPQDPKGMASCQPLSPQSPSCQASANPQGRIASVWDDASEAITQAGDPAQGAGLCIDLNFTGVPPARRAANYNLSGYFLDWDDSRDANIILSANGLPIFGSALGGFQQGKYVTWNLGPLPDLVTVQVNRQSQADVNAIISGLFLDRADSPDCGAPHIQLQKLTNGVDTPLRVPTGPAPGGNAAPSIVAGATVTWTYVVTNPGPEDLNNITLFDDKAGGVTCPATTLAVNASMTCTKTGVALDLSTAGGTVLGVCNGIPNQPKYENTGHVSGNGVNSGIQVTADYVSHYCNPPGSYTIVKTPDGATYSLGDNISFTMVVTSTGPGSANNVVLTDPLPTLGNLNSWAISSDPTGLCSITSGKNLNCPYGNLANGQTRTVTVTTNVAGGANATACPGNTLLNNVATITGSGLPTLSDNGDYTCTPPSYTLTKSPKNATYNIGDNISFQMVVASTGPGTAKNVQLSDPLPTLGNLSTWVITTNPGGACGIAANNLTCSFGDLANGQTRTVVVATNAAGGANSAACPGGVKLNNTATMTGTGLPTKTDTGDYTCTSLPPPGSFTLTKSPKGATYNVGQNISFTMVVTSTGPGTANNVVLNDPLPTLGNLNVWAITSDPSSTCTLIANTLNCPFGNLVNGQVRTVAVATNVVGGANATACPGGVTMNNTATVTATGLATKTDTGDYTCTPSNPQITIKKYTNGFDANDPDGTDVPFINPSTSVTWRYDVKNTGTVAIPKANISVTDNTPGVTPAAVLVGGFVSGDANSNNMLDPGETWIYQATGIALDLTLAPPAGVHTVAGVCSKGGTQPPSTAYTNIGTVTIPGGTASDPSSYCNPPVLACPAGGFTFNFSANGDLNMVFDQFPAPNDNSYGVNAVGWGTKGHKFSDLTGSDKAGFQLRDGTGTVKLSFNIDYITAKTGTPSGYASLGPFGGDGSIVTGTLTTADLTWDSSLARNLNNLGYFVGGTQVASTKTATNGTDLLLNSPPTLDTVSNYTLKTPNPWANGWDFHDTYFVTIKASKLAAIGFNAATWKVEPNLTALHNSPAKACPVVAGGGNVSVSKAAAASGKNVTLTLLDNNTSVSAILTALNLTWPAANGKLTQVKFDSDIVYDVDTNAPSLSLTKAQLQAASSDAKRTIDKGTSDVMTLIFQNNADTNMTHYTGTAQFNDTQNLNLFP